jgi:hypothetical protein
MTRLPLTTTILLALLLGSAHARAAQITLHWTAPTEYLDGSALGQPAGYRLYRGSSAGTYTTSEDVGALTQATLTDLPDDRVTHVAVAAYTASGAESPLSADLMIEPTPPVETVWHSADYAAPFGVIDDTELARALAYWRTGGYSADPSSPDGYVATATPPSDADPADRHRGDFRAPYYQFDGTEIARLLAYWRAGGYTPDPSGPDGYAPAAATLSLDAFTSAAATAPAITQQLPAAYNAGTPLVVSNSLAFDGSLLSLNWCPQLPTGWELLSVSGDGDPETIRGEIVWTGALPPSPIRITYHIAVPVWAYREGDIGAEVGLFEVAAANPSTSQAPAVPLRPEDLDDNGLADAWERLHAGESAALQPLDDADGDGLHNLAEYLAGTAPHDPRSVLGMLGVLKAGSTAPVIRWQSAPGRTYDIFKRTSNSDAFVLLAQGVGATPPENRFDDTTGTQGAAGCFYKVQLVP